MILQNHIFWLPSILYKMATHRHMHFLIIYIFTSYNYHLINRCVLHIMELYQTQEYAYMYWETIHVTMPGTTLILMPVLLMSGHMFVLIYIKLSTVY